MEELDQKLFDAIDAGESHDKIEAFILKGANANAVRQTDVDGKVVTETPLDILLKQKNRKRLINWLIRLKHAVTYQELSLTQEFWKAVKNLDLATLNRIFKEDKCPDVLKSYGGLWEAIIFAISHNDVKMLQLFLSRLEVIPSNIKPAPLEVAIMTNNLEIVKLLIKKETFWMKWYGYLNSPVYIAHLTGNKEIEDYLWKCLEQKEKKRFEVYKTEAEFHK